MVYKTLRYSADRPLIKEEDLEYVESLEKLVITSAKLFQNATRFKSLFLISFAYCSPLPNLDPLQQYVVLGLLDVSFTNISYKSLQKACRHTHLIRINCFGCTNLSIERNHKRGFLIYILSNVWVLNGIFVSGVERRKWMDFFTNDIRGMYSSLLRKFKIEDSRFVSTVPQYKTIVTEEGEKWIGDLPATFRMLNDYDFYKLDKLVTAFQTSYCPGSRFVKEIVCFKDLIAHEQSLERKIIFLLLVFGLLFDEHIPSSLLKASMNQIFGADFGYIEAGLNLKERLYLLGLLLGRLDIECASAINESTSKFRIEKERLQHLKRIISLLIGCVYSNPSQYKRGMDCDSVQFPKEAACSLEFYSKLGNPELNTVAFLRLQLLELICYSGADADFCKEFGKLYQILKSSLVIVSNGQHTPDPALLWSAEEARDIAMWGISVTYDSNDILIQSKITEMKARICLCVHDVFEFITSDFDTEPDIEAEQLMAKSKAAAFSRSRV